MQANGIANLAALLMEANAKGASKSEFMIAKMLDNDCIRINGIKLDKKDYKILDTLYKQGDDTLKMVKNFEKGDEVLVFKPNNETIIIIGKII